MSKIIGADEQGYYDNEGYVSDVEAHKQGFITPSPEAHKMFRIDKDNSDDEYLYVDVLGRGTVVIKAEEEGIVVDIYPFHVVDEPVASTWAHMNDLMDEELKDYIKGEDIIVDNRFKVVVVGNGDSYGRNNVLTHDKDDQLVEFWDTKHDQFVSRYYRSTLLKGNPTGLNLQGDVPEWSVSKEGMDRVRKMLGEL